MLNNLLGKMSPWLIHRPRLFKQSILMVADAVLVIFSIWSAYSLRYGSLFMPSSSQLFLMLTGPLLAIPVFIKMQLYNSITRYLGEHTIWLVTKGMSFAVLLWSAMAFMTQMTGIEGVPRVVPLLYWLIGILSLSTLRFIARKILLSHPVIGTSKRVLIYGAGEPGRQLAATLRCGRELIPAGFLDDDLSFHGKNIDGLHVYAPAQIAHLIKQLNIQDVVITLPSISDAKRQAIIDFLEQHNLRVLSLPALTDIAKGKYSVNMIKEVSVDDLLGRDSVMPDEALLGRCINKKIVLVTGAGGSIGSELCKQVAAIGPALMVLLESNEYALYQVARAIQGILGPKLVVACLGSVQDSNLMSSLFKEYKVQTVYHAAAYKHVSIVETNILEGVKNNVFGTLTVTQAAFDAKVETFILVSTDKAVRPTSIMGATKRWAELIIQYFSSLAQNRGQQRFCSVRFGNVLGSSGSVIPLFKEQIAKGGPVTVTDPEVVRYFMSLKEAVELIIQAGSLAMGGEVFLLDMGEPIKIYNLAYKMVELAGKTVKDAFNPEGDIEIVITKLNPGEKLYEELLISNSGEEGTQHPKIKKINEPYLDEKSLFNILDQLKIFIDTRNEEALREILMKSVKV